MRGNWKRFAGEEDGAVTADWVVLTAAVMLMTVAMMASVTQSSLLLGPVIASEIESSLP